MKWEKYNKLTNKEKEEYNFKFNKSYLAEINPRAMVHAVILLWLVSINYIFLLYIVLKDDTGVFDKYIDVLLETFSNIGQLTCVVLIFCLVFVVVSVGYIIYKAVKEDKWLKEHIK